MSYMTDPPAYAAVVAPNDGANLSSPTRAIWVGTSGDVRVTTVGGNDITFPSVPVGWFSIQAIKVWNTGTTAGNLRAGW